MYIYIYIYIYIYMYAYIHTYTHTYIHTNKIAYLTDSKPQPSKNRSVKCGRGWYRSRFIFQ